LLEIAAVPRGATAEETSMADTTRVNPWQWQDPFAFSQAIDVRGAQRVLYCAGQPSATLLGVTSLFHPDILIEIEATPVA
jgi:enamine deaminase RidA (YjgF/YER057c/UK114 family)